MTKLHNYGAAFLVVSSLAFPTLSSAQGGLLEEIVVTATKRQQTLQEIPIAVSVTSAETVQKAAILDIKDLQSVVPSLRVTQLQNSANTNFVIRGFGNGANNPGIEPSVAVFIDGVYRSRSGSAISDLPNIQRIEVLRGPQSTLFGKNASAGVISIITKKPTGESAGSVSATVGNYGQLVLKGQVEGSFSDNVAFDIAAGTNTNDGYFKNLNTGNDINNRDRQSIRGQLVINPSDETEIRIIADYDQIDEECCGVINIVSGPASGAINFVGGQLVPNDREALEGFYDKDPLNQIENSGISIQIDKDYSKFALTSITSLRKADSFSSVDVDFTSAAIVNNEITTEIDTFTQEIRLTSTDGDKIDWMIGGFYFDESIDYEKFALTSITSLRKADSFSSVDVDFTSAAIVNNEITTNIDTFTQEIRLTSTEGDKIDWMIGGFYFDESIDYENNLPYGADFRPYLGTLAGNPDLLTGLELAFGLPLFQTLAVEGDRVREEAELDNEAFSIFGTVDWHISDRLTATVGLNYTKDEKQAAVRQTDRDNLSGIDFVAAGFAGIFSALTGGAAPIPANFAAFPTAFATAQALATNPAFNPLLGLQAFQFLPPFVDFPNSVEDGKSDDDDLTYTIRLAFDVSDSVSVYGGISTGFKATSWNLSRDSRPSDLAPIFAAGLGVANLSSGGTRFASPEESEVIEFGLKARFERGSLNIAIFDQEIANFQSNIFRGSAFSLVNAGLQSTTGIEFDLAYYPTDALKFTLAGTFLDPKYDSFVGAPGPNGTTDLSGTTPGGIHETSISTSVEYGFQLKSGTQAFIRGDYQYDDEIPTNDNLPSTISSTREVKFLNLSAGIITDNGLSVTLWGRNVTDHVTLITGFPSVAQPGSFSGYRTTPRTYGVTVSKDF